MKPVLSPSISLFNKCLVLFPPQIQQKGIKLIKHIRPVHRLRMHAALPPLPRMISWRGVPSGTETNMHFKQSIFLAKNLEGN